MSFPWDKQVFVYIVILAPFWNKFLKYFVKDTVINAIHYLVGVLRRTSIYWRKPTVLWINFYLKYQSFQDSIENSHNFLFNMILILLYTKKWSFLFILKLCFHYPVFFVLKNLLTFSSAVAIYFWKKTRFFFGK